MSKNNVSKALFQKRNILFLLLSTSFLLGCGLTSRLEKATSTPGGKINYCMNDSSTLCVVSFGSDDRNNMVINLVTPDSDAPEIYISAGAGDSFNTYACQKVDGFPNNIICTGPRVPLGSALQINVYTLDEKILLAQGTFLVNALALPTAVLVNSTATQSGESVLTPVKTSTAARRATPTSTRSVRGTTTATPRVSATPTSKTRTPVSPTAATESYTYP